MNANKLVQEAMFPRSRSEERLGVDLDVAAMRIMLGAGTQTEKQAALKQLLNQVRR